MNVNDLILDTIDCRGARVVFKRKKWEVKSIQHLELKNRTFLNNVKKTINNPDEVWQDYSRVKNKRCYYKKYSSILYVKVVLWLEWIGDIPCYVVTAFQTNFIKETKYSELKKYYNTYGYK